MKRVAHRAITFVHRQLSRAERVMSQLPLVLFDSPVVENEAMLDHYAAATRYLDPSNQRAGLYPFEQRAVDRFFPKPPARLLLPGCGAGRELLPLLDLGYDVDAFDPTPKQVAGARALVGGRARIEETNFERWGVGAGSVRYDAIFVGWGAWTHLVRRVDRLETLAAFRKACPNGPMLLSFFRRERVFNLEEVEPKHDLDDQGRLERFFQRYVRETLLGREPLEEGTGWSGGMFAHYVSEQELREEGGRTGWDLAYYERDASRFPHAVLTPGVGGPF